MRVGDTEKGRKFSRSDQLWSELDETLGLEDSKSPGIFILVSESLGYSRAGVEITWGLKELVLLTWVWSRLSLLS